MKIKNLIHKKYLTIINFYISKLILILISCFISKEIIFLFFNLNSSSKWISLLFLAVLSIFLSLFSLIGAVINYKCISILFMGTNFQEKFRLKEFLSIISTFNLLSSLLISLVFIFLNSLLSSTVLRELWPTLSNSLWNSLTFFSLCFIGINLNKKYNISSILSCITYCILPYTAYNIIIYIFTNIINIY